MIVLLSKHDAQLYLNNKKVEISNIADNNNSKKIVSKAL